MKNVKMYFLHIFTFDQAQKQTICCGAAKNHIAACILTLTITLTLAPPSLQAKKSLPFVSKSKKKGKKSFISSNFTDGGAAYSLISF